MTEGLLRFAADVRGRVGEGVRSSERKEYSNVCECKLEEFSTEEETTSFPFRELVGSLMWLATQTRPDISNAVRAVARYCTSPKLIHWRTALGILGYARRTAVH